jgi:vesicle transport protein SEC22
MTKNIEDLLYRGDSLERMGELSGRLREDSKKYRRAAVRINWELVLKQVTSPCPHQYSVRLDLHTNTPAQYGPIAGVGLFVLFLIWLRFF